MKGLTAFQVGLRMWLVSVLLALISTLTLAVGVQTVFAGHAGGCPLAGGRCEKHGYASDAAFPPLAAADQVMSTGNGLANSSAGMPVNNADEFVNRIRVMLFNLSTADAARQDRLGSAFIVNTMLGRPGGDFTTMNPANPRQAHVDEARANINEWESRVRAYDIAGQVEWGASQFYPANFINSAYSPVASVSDDFFYTENTPITVPSIIFKDVSGAPQYMIKKNCGNPAGIILPLDDDGTTPTTPPPVPPTPPPPVTAPGCPSMLNSLQTVNLPPQGVPGPAAPPPTGPAGATYYTYAADGTYAITNIVDQWGQTAPYSPPGKNSNPFVIDYRPYITDYPYDLHDLTVSYRTYYDQSVYQADATGSVVYVGPGTQDLYANSTISDPVIPKLEPCYDRGFNLTPSFNGVPLFDDTENPTQVTFGTRIEADFSFPNVTPPSGQVRAPFKINFNTTVRYEVQKANGTTILYPSSLSRISASSSGGADCPFTGFNNGSPTAMSIGGTNVKTATTVGCDYTERYQAKVPPLEVGDIVCIRFMTVAPAAGRMRVDGSPSAVTVASRSATGAPVCSEPLVNKPYMKVYGADVAAGGAFVGGNCTNASKIGAYYRSAPQLSGSSVQFAALAMGTIDQFASAQQRTATPIIPPIGLTFANTSGTYGGNFGGSRCIADFYGSIPDGATGIGGSVTISSLSDGAYTGGGTVTITGGGPVTGKKALFVDGTVIISGNIAYNTAAPATLDDIPSLYIVARNIYIDKSVSQLDGTFVAQPSNPASPGGDGLIYTCATSTTPVPAATLFNDCQTSLTINGAFVAQQVKFHRAFSSLRHSNRAEYPTNAPPLNGCLPNPRLPTDYTCAAEIFNFSPETYLAEPALRPTRSGASGKYDYITSLPPVL